MFRYVLTVFIASFFACVSIARAQDDKFEFNISDNTPASFFSSGIATYFFRDGLIGVFQYSGDRLYYGAEKADGIGAVKDVPIRLREKYGREDLILIPDGSAKFVKDVGEDYACPWDSLQNCLYSDIIITGIDVKNLMGKINTAKVDAGLEFKKAAVKFPIGAKMYRFNTVLPLYDFDGFDDFSSLVCSKNEDGACRGVVSGGVLDMAALFELVQGRGAISGIMYAETGKYDLAYVYDIENMAVIPYSASCLEKAGDTGDLESCSREKELGGGVIREQRHKKSGIVYWIVDYKKPGLDNVIFWLNSRGEPFKAYTNPFIRKVFNMYNETAAETILEAI